MHQAHVVVPLHVVPWLDLHAEHDAGWLRFDCRCRMLTIAGACSIYAERPTVCRDYVAGGAACLDTLRRRRTPEHYARIREDGDPMEIHDGQ